MSGLVLPPSFGSLVLPDGRLLIEAATEHQLENVAAVLAREPVQRRHWLRDPRGSGKTHLAAAMTVCAALDGVLGVGEEGFFAAADREQAGLTAQAIAGFALRTPDLEGRVVVETNKVYFPESHVTVRILSSDAASGYGRTGAWWVADELCSWPDTPAYRSWWEVVSTSWPKLAHTRVVIISTAGSPAHFARKEYELALTDPAWRVSETHEPAAWILPEDIERERRCLSAGSFARLWENRWVEAEEALVTREDLAECTVLEEFPVPPRAGCRYVAGVDLGIKDDSTVLAVGHAEYLDNEPFVFLDELIVWKPRRGRQVSLSDVEDRVEQIAKRYDAEVYVDPHQALGMLQSLRRRGIRVEEQVFSASYNDKLAQGLHTALRDQRLALPDDPELSEELLNVRVTETSFGTLRLDHRSGRHDDQAVAIGIVLTKLLGRPIPRPAVGFTAADYTI